MTHTATARIATDSASKYLQQLCKHWQHNLAVSFTPEHGTVTFPRNIRGQDFPGDATATFEAATDALAIRIEATSTEQLQALEGAVASHLDRFAFREGPFAYVWE